MKKNIILILSILLVFKTVGSTCSTREKQVNPNIVFILADDLGWADLPVYGNKFNEAPAIAQLAKDGIYFPNAYAACPVCSPTRASIMSGQYPARVGITDFIPGHWRPYEKVIVPKNRNQYLPSEITTIGEAMKSAGYATGYFGKWHLGNESEYHPLNQGFDESNVGQGYYNVKFTPPRAEGTNRRLSELLADFGEEFIRKHQKEPFFLFLAHFDVHVQLDADQELIDKYRVKTKIEGYPCNAVYAAMIKHLDQSVGRITKKLEELKLSENTIVVFFSDNGGLNKRYDSIPLLADSKASMYKNDSLLYVASSNKPLRGEKGTLYEGGIRVPLIVKWPAKIKKGMVSDAIVSSVDFFPTLVELAGRELPDDQVFDGKSLVSVLLGKNNDSERAIFWHYPVYHHDEPANAVRKGDWKLVQNLVDNHYELFNLRKDIQEANNCASTEPGKLDEMIHILKEWQQDIGAELPSPNPNFNKQKRYEWGTHPDRIAKH
ncbi:sulfatase [Maribellus maritimus]|uniref:sulfatase n=1 Tax=Maribellus maritimus TaxID=2870838 RepID=UPI001EE9B42B|nr:sulfatase [Maribellus maritimus]MCG6191327.1 sulfatase [Maribellus maritimus]